MLVNMRWYAVQDLKNPLIICQVLSFRPNKSFRADAFPVSVMKSLGLLTEGEENDGNIASGEQEMKDPQVLGFRSLYMTKSAEQNETNENGDKANNDELDASDARVLET